jgi:multiple sugar transport system permease protein
MSVSLPQLEERSPTIAAEPATDPHRRRSESIVERGVVSDLDRRRPLMRATLGATHVLLLVFLVIVGLGPLLWLFKAATTPTRDILRTPMALWPHGFDLENISTAWNDAEISKYFFNTLRIAFGSWLSQLLVALTGGYVLGILKPRYASFVTILVLITLFVPPVVLLVPLFLTVLDLPIVGISLLNSYWAIWLPAGASAFNVIIVKRFFENIPREIIEAATVDGAGTFRLFWSVVLPMSKPIIGVVSVFAVLTAWKDYLWPLIVLSNPAIQPLSVRLPTVRDTLQLDVFLAALAISTIFPVALFLVFQRLFLGGNGLSGAVKG